MNFIFKSLAGPWFSGYNDALTRRMSPVQIKQSEHHRFAMKVRSGPPFFYCGDSTVVSIRPCQFLKQRGCDPGSNPGRRIELYLK